MFDIAAQPINFSFGKRVHQIMRCSVLKEQQGRNSINSEPNVIGGGYKVGKGRGAH
jgi:hypothetical protein